MYCQFGVEESAETLFLWCFTFFSFVILSFCHFLSSYFIPPDTKSEKDLVHILKQPALAPLAQAVQPSGLRGEREKERGYYR